MMGLNVRSDMNRRRLILVYASLLVLIFVCTAGAWWVLYHKLYNGRTLWHTDVVQYVVAHIQKTSVSGPFARDRGIELQRQYLMGVVNSVRVRYEHTLDFLIFIRNGMVAIAVAGIVFSLVLWAIALRGSATHCEMKWEPLSRLVFCKVAVATQLFINGCFLLSILALKMPNDKGHARLQLPNEVEIQETVERVLSIEGVNSAEDSTLRYLAKTNQHDIAHYDLTCKILLTAAWVASGAGGVMLIVVVFMWLALRRDGPSTKSGKITKRCQV